jgi:hypothetical protein
MGTALQRQSTLLYCTVWQTWRLWRKRNVVTVGTAEIDKARVDGLVLLACCACPSAVRTYLRKHVYTHTHTHTHTNVGSVRQQKFCSRNISPQKIAPSHATVTLRITPSHKVTDKMLPLVGYYVTRTHITYYSKLLLDVGEMLRGVTSQKNEGHSGN